MILWFPSRPHLPLLSRLPLKSPIQHSWNIPTAFIRPLLKSRTRPFCVHLSPATSNKNLQSWIQKCPECLLRALSELQRDPSLPPSCSTRAIAHPPLFICHPSFSPSLFSTSAGICSSLIEVYNFWNSWSWDACRTLPIMCVWSGMHRCNICAERSNGKWCCKCRARNICHSLTCQRIRLHAHTSMHSWGCRCSDTPTSKHGSGLLSHTINHPSSNCPWLPCSRQSAPWQPARITDKLCPRQLSSRVTGAFIRGLHPSLEWFLHGKSLKVW